MKYKCKNFMNNCPVSENPIELEEMDDKTKCPECGKDTLEEFVEKKKNPILAKLKTPLVAAIIGIGSLGGAYYCFTGDGCFGNDDKNRTEMIAPIASVEEKNETKIVMPQQAVSEVKLKSRVDKDQALEEEKSAWEQAKSLEELELFVQKYPNSLYCSNAEIKIDNLKKEKVEEENQRFSLTVNAIPRDARVSITNIRAQYYDGIALRKGKYDIKISKSGYFTKQFSVFLSNDRSIVKTLEKKPEKKFSLTINTTPSDARVSITNIKSKYYDGIALKKGNYDIKVSKSGYITKRFSVDLSNDRSIDRTLEKEPEKKFSLTVNTTPSDARVSITNIEPKYYDGIALKKGTYNIKISKSGYVTKRFSVDLSKNKRLHRTLEEIYVPPPPTRYSLTIDTIPSNAYVSHNSGVVFNNGARLSRGSYSFTISKNGYHSREISIFLDKNMRKVVELTRKRIAPPPPPKSECTKMLDRIEKYTKDGREDKKLQELNRFDANRRNCTPSEQARGDKF